MEHSRRTFLKITGAAAIGLGAGTAVNVLASGGGHETAQPEMRVGEKALKAKQWAMVIDTRKIHSIAQLEPMFEVCHKIHNVPHFTDPRHIVKWIWEDEFKHVFPEKEHEFVSERVEHLPFLALCNHCQDPPCVRACPTKATFKRDDGIVMMDFHRCIGCRFCMAACPYGSRSFNFVNPRTGLVPEEINPEFPTRMKGVVEKCNFCAERLAVGKLPACVEASGGILTFGDLDDPDSPVRHLLKENYTIRRKPNLGTGPSVYYIV